jgi:hypothetical protein
MTEADDPLAGRIVAPPAIIWPAIGCKPSYGYELLRRGELESFLVGRNRQIVVQSARDYIDRRRRGVPLKDAPKRSPLVPLPIAPLGRTARANVNKKRGRS